MVSMGTQNMTNHKESTSLKYHPVLLAIYIMVFLFGTISQIMMINIFKSRHTSTSIAVLNLIFTHFVFLLTVPFRIYYYATHHWGLSYEWCKWVSAMIHIHMYMSFIFYVIILVMRLVTFYCRLELVGDVDKLRALGGSAVVWILVLVLVPSILYSSYGKGPGKNQTVDTNNVTHCFEFGGSIYDGAMVVNYIISTLIIIVTVVLTALQANALRVLYMKNRQRFTSHQDFGHHLKSLCFALIMVVCFVPYHMFRLYYLQDIDALQGLNEVLLTLTTFNCLDMVTFLGGRVCSMCIPSWAT